MAALAPALPFIGLGLSIVSSLAQAKTQVAAGAVESRGLSQQAAVEQVRGRGESIKYKQQGVEVLKNIVRTNATLNARAAAGGIDPYSGSALGLSRFTESEGAMEYFVTQDNQIIAREGGTIQAQLYMNQAEQARRGGVASAAGTLLSAGTSLAKIGGPPKIGSSLFGSGVSYKTSGAGGAGLLV